MRLEVEEASGGAREDWDGWGGEGEQADGREAARGSGDGWPERLRAEAAAAGRRGRVQSRRRRTRTHRRRAVVLVCVFLLQFCSLVSISSRS